MLIIPPVLLTALALCWLALLLRFRRAYRRFDICWRGDAMATRYYILKRMARGGLT